MKEGVRVVVTKGRFLGFIGTVVRENGICCGNEKWLEIDVDPKGTIILLAPNEVTELKK